MDPDSKRLRVSVTDGRGRSVRDGGLARWLESVAPARACGEVAVALVGDTRIRALNRTYRKKDHSTDVLSFPAEAVSSSSTRSSRSNRGRRRKPREPRTTNHEPRTTVLGDIVIARGVARRQARDAGHSSQTELRVLALHGLLHLIGYDHEDTDDAGRMARLEVRLRRKGGLGAGLIERGSPRRPRS